MGALFYFKIGHMTGFYRSNIIYKMDERANLYCGLKVHMAMRIDLIFWLIRFQSQLLSGRFSESHKLHHTYNFESWRVFAAKSLSLDPLQLS